jgi:hypothetical protein
MVVMNHKGMCNNTSCFVCEQTIHLFNMTSVDMLKAYTVPCFPVLVLYSSSSLSHDLAINQSTISVTRALWRKCEMLCVNYIEIDFRISITFICEA